VKTNNPPCIISKKNKKSILFCCQKAHEDIVFYIEKGNILDDYLNPNQKKYPEQRIMVIGTNNYAYLVPYVEDAEAIFLKTIIPSRKATEIYLGREHDS
jgi:hypothetical protein